jgi:hypothetical protein
LVRFVCFGCGAHVWFGSLIEYWCVVRHVSQLHYNQLFSNNKVSIKAIPISMDLSSIPLNLLSFSWIFFISSTLKLQMANTRNRNNNNNGDNNRENNHNVNPPPPPPPTLEQVLVMRAQMLQTMQ